MERNKDPWKKWVSEHKDAFDLKEPRDLWEGIETDLEKDMPLGRQEQDNGGKLIPLRVVYRIAALFIISLGVGYFLMYNHFSSSEPITADKKNKANVEEEMAYPIELVEAENYYAAEINQKMNELVLLTDDETIMEELDFLRSEFEELRKEMGDNINDERIVEAMIQNYRLRLELLKEIVSELQIDSAPKNDAYETESI